MIPKIKSLTEPIDFYGKTWIVNTICKEDLEGLLSKKQIKELSDETMSIIAESLGEAMADCFWECLETILFDYGLSKK